MKLLYMSETTHRRIRALALRDRRPMATYIDILMESEMAKVSPKKRNDLYAELDEPRVVPGGKP